MSDWREFFKTWEHRSVLSRRYIESQHGCDITETASLDEVYQNFFARRESEAKEKLTKVFGAPHCSCPVEPEKALRCDYLKDDEVCTHPSNKPPEPECEHRHKDGPKYGSNNRYFLYRDSGDKHCRNCGDKLND